MKCIRFFLVLLLASSYYCALSPQEIAIRKRLGIPDDVSRVLIFGQTSHMDWDWVKTFPEYYYQSVENILSLAFNLVDNNYNKTIPFYYGVSEVGFYEKFLDENPEKAERLKQISDKFIPLGAGISTPDNLLPHGEVFIRNYLEGKAVLREFGLPMSYTCWIPDDFGHDPQLPIVLKAMGLNSTSLSRVPGLVVHTKTHRVDRGETVVDSLRKDGTDFYWKASDGSTIFSHVMLYHYNSGDSIDNHRTRDCSTHTARPAEVIRRVRTLIDKQTPLSRTPYMFMPIGDDFATPKSCLLEICSIWNQHNNEGLPYILSGTFEDYKDLIIAHNERSEPPSIPTTPFYPVPYWTGFYTSRPYLKLSHEESVRYAMAAEIFSIFTGGSDLFRAYLKNAWRALTPSTHHDFITGTAPDHIYHNEQVPYMKSALKNSMRALNITLNHISGSLSTGTKKSKGVVLYNALGFDYHGTVEVKVPREQTYGKAMIGSTAHPVQYLRDGSLFFKAKVPALGYTIAHLAPGSPPSIPSAVTVEESKGSIIMKNDIISLKLEEAYHWAITSMIDLKTLTETINSTACSMVFYRDMGNIYRYANEISSSCSFTLIDPIVKSKSIEVVEKGPLKATVKATVEYEYNSVIKVFITTYSLVYGENQVRVSIHGGAFRESSVFTSLDFNRKVEAVRYGTPYHYETHIPHKYWTGPTFTAVHNYLALYDIANKPIATLSQSTIRGWAFDKGSTVVYGALFRNTPRSRCANYGADGTDPDDYTYEFTIQTDRDFNESKLLTNSLSYTTPPYAQLIESPSLRHTEVSLFHFEDVEGQMKPIITTAKHGSFEDNVVIVRFYAEVTEGKPVTSSLVSHYEIVSVRPVTALEETLDDDSVTIVVNAPNKITITQKYAIGSIEVVLKK